MSVSNKALWYIESHLSGDLSIETIAASSHVSPFHLSRAFPLATGQSLAAYARARRLSEAAKLLANGAPDILALALEAGYGSHEAFTRAFRQLFGLAPEQLRAQASLDNLNLMEPLKMNQATSERIAAPRIVQGRALRLFGLSQRYRDNAGMPAQWSAFLPHIGHIRNQVGNIAYGVVSNTDEAGTCDYLTGVEVSEFPSQPAEFTRLEIPAQTYAVFEHKGHISSIGATWKAILDQVHSPEFQAADGPSFERYDENFDGRTGLGGLEIWIPVVS